MLKILIFAGITIAVTTSAYKLRENNDNYILYRGQIKFTASLLNALWKNEPENDEFFSPHSTYRALFLAFMGSKGLTEKSLKHDMFLDWAKNKANVIKAYKKEASARAARFLYKQIQFNSVDKLYFTKKAQLK